MKTFLELKSIYFSKLAGSIHCPSTPRHPPDALLKPMAQHRRARSAAWSYRFQPNQEWCELIVSLPTAILLHEVHIQPHSTGLSSRWSFSYLSAFIYLQYRRNKYSLSGCDQSLSQLGPFQMVQFLLTFVACDMLMT